MELTTHNDKKVVLEVVGDIKLPADVGDALDALSVELAGAGVLELELGLEPLN